MMTRQLPVKGPDGSEIPTLASLILPSGGIEDANDLFADLDQALRQE